MPAPPRPALAGVIVLVVFAGCLGEPDPPAGMQAQAQDTALARPVVVALIDTGINPYHVAFAAGPGPDAGAFADGLMAETLHLSPGGDYESRVAADEGMWSTLEPGGLYAFAGTRVLTISFGHDKGGSPIVDTWNHGTRTASLVAREAPGALIVMVQVNPAYCPTLPECPVPPHSQAMAWVAAQPWIDIVSVSLNVLANAPVNGATTSEAAAYIDASRLAHERGKLVVNSAGNELGPTLGSYFCGPAWVICVGGAYPTMRGETALASKGVDVVANYTELTAVAGSSEEEGWAAGTSMAAPIVAGVLAQALETLQAEREGFHPSGLREALNATAIPFSVSEWNPTRKPTNDSLYNLGSVSAPVLFASAQMGWGYVDGSMAQEIARRVLEDDLAPPPEKAQTAAYMAQWQSLREQYWRNAP